MLAQETKHLSFFTEQMKLLQVRPSIMVPIWNLAGKVLGVTSSIFGNRTAMLVTEAIEDIIEKHYTTLKIHYNFYYRKHKVL